MELLRFIEYVPGEFRGAFLFIYLKKDIANVCSIMYNALYRVTAADLFEEGTGKCMTKEELFGKAASPRIFAR